jgi:hypothetical protein
LTTATTTTAIVPFDPVLADPRRLALGGFLAGYSGLTRDAYELDLRQFVGWCDDHQLDLFQVRRVDIEAFAGDSRGAGVPGRPWPEGCARSPASTATRKRDGCWPSRQVSTCADLASTTSHTPPGWTGTRSGRCSSPPAWATRPNTRSPVAPGAQRATGVRGDRWRHPPGGHPGLTRENAKLTCTFASPWNSLGNRRSIP